ncbi:MAG TPA: F0F1 ATP synthase subunit delta [Candidatus Dormibacteraeota bacterium]|jgi:F-type H+-transporting ATPase subunit delta|nr:F0F1 ATP synthase subunit delta [Candidatus Dormibacteraeota bacterium]
MASSIGRRYAQAYFDLARTAGKIPEWREDLVRSVDILSNPEVAAALANPRLTLSDRTRLAIEVLEGVGEPARNLVRLLIERGRLGVLADLVETYDVLTDRDSGVIRATVTTAVAADDDLSTRISTALSEKLGAAVQTEVHQDPSILGGLVIRIGDRVIDNSLRTRLQQLRTALV